MSGQADKVSHASLNGIYVKAQELDRGHNADAPPVFAPPGSPQADVDSHASTHAGDVRTHVGDPQTHASDAADVKSHASTHASDADSHASAVPAHAAE